MDKRNDATRQIYLSVLVPLNKSQPLQNLLHHNMLSPLSSVWKTVQHAFEDQPADTDQIMATTDTVCSVPALHSDIDPDAELVPFLSTKLTECIATWMQANYIALVTNYKAIFEAYTELKSNYNQIIEQNEAQKAQIESLKLTMKETAAKHNKEMNDCKKLIDSNLEELNSYKRSITSLQEQPLSQDTISQEELRYDHNQKDINQEIQQSLLIQQWKSKVAVLEEQIAANKHKSKMNAAASLQCIQRVQELKTERKAFQQEIRNLKQQNKYLELRLESKEKESDFHAKCIENATSLKEMEHVHTLQKYQELTKNHQHNMRAMDSFLNQVTNRCHQFLSKYSGKEIIEGDDNHNGSGNGGSSPLKGMVRMKGIDSKLTMTYANLEQFLQDVSMLMLEKENAHLKRIEEDDLVMTDSETCGDSMVIAVD